MFYGKALKVSSTSGITDGCGLQYSPISVNEVTSLSPPFAFLNHLLQILLGQMPLLLLLF